MRALASPFAESEIPYITSHITPPETNAANTGSGSTSTTAAHHQHQHHPMDGHSNHSGDGLSDPSSLVNRADLTFLFPKNRSEFSHMSFKTLFTRFKRSSSPAKLELVELEPAELDVSIQWFADGGFEDDYALQWQSLFGGKISILVATPCVMITLVEQQAGKNWNALGSWCSTSSTRWFSYANAIFYQRICYMDIAKSPSPFTLVGVRLYK